MSKEVRSWAEDNEILIKTLWTFPGDIPALSL